MPIVQITSFPVSDAFTSDPKSFEVSVQELAKAEGYVGAWYGAQSEDAKQGYFISAWRSAEDRKKFVENPNFANIIASLKPALGGDPERDHFEVSADPSNALSAPTTEIAILTPKDGFDTEAVKAKGTPFLELLEKEAKGVHPPVLVGESLDNKGKGFVVIGWDSVKAHVDAVGAEPLAPMLTALRGVANVKVNHSNLTKFTGA